MANKEEATCLSIPHLIDKIGKFCLETLSHISSVFRARRTNHLFTHF